MKILTINDAKKIATDSRTPGVLVLQIDTEGHFSITTYGMKKQHCGAMKKVMDQIANLLSTGHIQVPDLE